MHDIPNAPHVGTRGVALRSSTAAKAKPLASGGGDGGTLLRRKGSPRLMAPRLIESRRRANQHDLDDLMTSSAGGAKIAGMRREHLGTLLEFEV